MDIFTAMKALHEWLACLEDLVSNDGEACQPSVVAAGSWAPLHKPHQAAYLPSHLKAVYRREVLFIGPSLDGL